MAIISGGKALRMQAKMPVIVNGDMAISQRSTSETGITAGSNGYHTVDRFRFNEGADPGAAFTMSQETLSSGNAYVNGFNYALKMDCTTADGSLGGDDFIDIEQRIEKQDLVAFKKGTANAEKFTLAFWVKATKTGTNIVEMQDQANDRAVSATYTINTTNTWEHKVVNFPADTTGSFGNDQSLGLILRWYLLAGANYQSASLQTAWGGAATNARANGQVNNGDNTSNNWHLTGVQLEIGEYDSTTIPPFQHESNETNLDRCKRYFQRISRPTHGGNTVIVGANSAVNNIAMVNLPVEMRAAPSVSQTGSSITLYSPSGSSNASASNPTLSAGTFGTVGGRFLWDRTGNIYSGFWVDLDNANSFYNFDAEL